MLVVWLKRLSYEVVSSKFKDNLRLYLAALMRPPDSDISVTCTAVGLLSFSCKGVRLYGLTESFEDDASLTSISICSLISLKWSLSILLGVKIDFGGFKWIVFVLINPYLT